MSNRPPIRIAAITIPAPVPIPPLFPSSPGDGEAVGVWVVADGLALAWAGTPCAGCCPDAYGALANAGRATSSMSATHTPNGALTTASVGPVPRYAPSGWGAGLPQTH
jgi:endonuclease YncB( thermonuclease family)